MSVNIMNYKFLSVIHAVYLLFVLRFFKTKYSLAHPITFFSNKLLYHPIGYSNVSRSPICKLGHVLSWYLSAFILIRGILFVKNRKFFRVLSLVVLCSALMLSLLNFNAVVLLLPHFFIEYFVYIN